MLILIDKKIPSEAKKTLSAYGELLELETSGITYDAISGHPDIFFFSSGSKLFAAPNLPGEYFDALNKNGIDAVRGSSPVKNTYPDTARYNAVLSGSYFIHNTSITDKSILETISGSRQILNVKQGYCRCSLLPLKNDCFITSDPGIFKILQKENLKSVFIHPRDIILPGFPHGFIGGACGISGDRIFITGGLKHLSGGKKLRDFLNELDYKIIELYDGPLFDGGSLLFLNDEL